MEENIKSPKAVRSESDELPSSPESKPLSGPKRSKRRLLFSVLIALLIIVVAATAFVYPRLKIPARAEVVVKDTPSRHTAVRPSVVEEASFGDVKAAYVTLPLTKTQAEADPVYGPGQNIVTTGGHYLVLDPSGYTYDAKNNEGGKLLYDRSAVYNGPHLFRFALSDNGRHYLYVLDTDPKHTTGSQDIYVDGKKVQSVADAEGIYYIHLSDNGKDYAFATGNPDGYLSTTELDKDGSTIFTANNGIEALAFSSDLSKYVLATPSAPSVDQYDLIADGQAVARNINFMGASQPSIALSSNGGHYIYTDGKTVFAESDATQPVKGIAAMGVNDNGSFGVVDPLSNVAHVNSRNYTLPSSFASACNPDCGAASPDFSMSNDGLHYVYGMQYSNLWDLDGSTITPVGDVENVEFIGDTLYLYRWTDAYSNWKTYTSKLGSISIKYPSTWTAPARPYDATVMNGTVQEELMTWQSPYEDFAGQQRAILMSLQALTGYQNCDANLPIYKTQDLTTADGHHLTVVMTASSNQIEYVYLTDATGLNTGDTLPTCSTYADIKSPQPQTKTIQITVQFVTPCNPGLHCGFVNSPLTSQQYASFPLISDVMKSFESITFN